MVVHVETHRCTSLKSMSMSKRNAEAQGTAVSRTKKERVFPHLIPLRCFKLGCQPAPHLA